MRFGSIDHVMLFGGGPQLVAFLEAPLETPVRFTVVAASRHARETLPDGRTLADLLADGGIDHILTDSLDDPRVAGAVTTSTLGVSKGAPWIFRKPFLELFHGRLVNFHGAPLPSHRGGGGYSWRILMGDRRGAALVHLVDEGVDTGRIVLCRPYEYPRECHVPADYEAVALTRNAALFAEFMALVAQGHDFDLEVQDEASASYFPRLRTDVHGAVDWSWGARDIESFIRAFDEPYAGASTLLDGEPVRLKECHFIPEGPFHPFMSGMVFRVHDGGVFVCAADAALRLDRVLDARGEDVTARVRPGQRLHTPAEDLERALSHRAVYTPQGLKEDQP